MGSARSGRGNGGSGGGIDFLQTRHDLHGARHLPGHIYYSEEIYELEIEKIWMKEWLCVARVEQFPKMGDYKAMRVAGEPVIVAKNDKGELNAFSNVCRHRGVEVAPVGTGNAKEFSCPYHGWLYGLDGKLIGAPFNKEIQKTFDFKNCRLNPVKLGVWEGFVFINFDADAIGLDAFLDDPGVRKCEELLKPGRTMISDVYTFELDCNWKMVPENFMDIYHAKAIHGDSFAKHFVMEGFGFEIDRGGRYHAQYQSNTMAPDGLSLFGPMPWAKDKDPDFAYTVFLPPNFNIFGRYDLVQPMLCYPLGPEKTQVTTWTQFPKEHFKLPAFWERNKVYTDFVRLVLQEDADMVASLQNGVRTRAFEPGPTVPLEKAIHNTLNYWIDRLFGEEEKIGAAAE
jgi:Rieske 2Fe-2S family protein